jgi:hypothetical protein
MFVPAAMKRIADSQLASHRSTTPSTKGRAPEAPAHNVSGRQKADRSRTAGTVGEGEGATEEGCLEPTEPAAAGYAAGFRV